MKRTLVLAALAMFVTASFAIAQDKKTMTADGKVKTVAADSVTVTDKAGKDWTFNVTPETKVIAKGGSHKAYDAAKENKPLMVTDIVKEGQKVRVKYSEMDGKMAAAEIKVM
jgi:hypothetical protein